MNRGPYPQSVQRERPGIVSVVALLQLLGGLFTLLVGLLVSNFGGLESTASGVMILILALAQFLAGAGLLMMKNWARIIALSTAPLGIALGILTVLLGVGVIPIAIGGLTLWSLTRPEVMAAFGVPIAPVLPYGHEKALLPGTHEPATFCVQCGAPLSTDGWRCEACGGWVKRETAS